MCVCGCDKVTIDCHVFTKSQTTCGVVQESHSYTVWTSRLCSWNGKQNQQLKFLDVLIKTYWSSEINFDVIDLLNHYTLMLNEIVFLVIFQMFTFPTVYLFSYELVKQLRVLQKSRYGSIHVSVGSRHTKPKLL